MEFVTERKFALACVRIWNPSHLFVQFKYLAYGHKQADIHTETHVLECSHASVGLAQAHPNQSLPEVDDHTVQTMQPIVHNQAVQLQ